jgi:hypothetical protein
MNGAAQAALASMLTLMTSAAHAGDFSQNGSYSFDAASIARWDFADGVAPEPLKMDDEAVEVVDRSDALSGAKVALLKSFQSLDLVVDAPAAAGRYRASLWLRGGDGVGYVGVSHTSFEQTDDVAALYPTGRMTSDGWVELANDGIVFDGARSKVVVGAFCASGPCEIDAVELVPDGQPQGEVHAACEGSSDVSSCQPGEVCLWYECKNARAWLPPIPDERAQLSDYLANRMQYLFGPFFNRSNNLPHAMAAIEGMRSADNPWDYWNGFGHAVRLLNDGHTTTSNLSDISLQNPRPLNLCFIEGHADLSHDKVPGDPFYMDVLVSHVGSAHNLGLAPGDRLVAIDGKHPIAWARAQRQHFWSQSSASNPRTYAEFASGLRRSISRFASSLDVIRCDAMTQTCGEVETIRLADLPAVPPGAELEPFVRCDNRPLRHLASSPETHGGGYNAVYYGIANESDANEKIYAVEWESLSTSNGNDGVGEALNDAVTQVITDASGVIFDHRTGTGGTILGPKIIWDFAVERHELTYYEDRQRAEDEQPTLAQGAATYAMGKNRGEVDYAGSLSPNAMPVALLITEDVSASDWLALGMKGQAGVKIFGPYETNGGFSTRLSFGYWLGVSYVIASGDTYLPGGETLNGTGVAPDVVVEPQQSDLLQGKDSVFEAALAWIRQELTP